MHEAPRCGEPSNEGRMQRANKTIFFYINSL